MSLVIALMMQTGLTGAEAALETVQPCLIENVDKVLENWPAETDAESDWHRIKAIRAACEPEIRATSIPYRVEVNKSEPNISIDQVQAALTIYAETFVTYTLIRRLENKNIALESNDIPDKYHGVWAKNDKSCRDPASPNKIQIQARSFLVYSRHDHDWKKLAAISDVAISDTDVRFKLSWTLGSDGVDIAPVRGRLVISDDKDILFTESLSEENEIDFLVRCRSLEYTQ